MMLKESLKRQSKNGYYKNDTIITVCCKLLTKLVVSSKITIIYCSPCGGKYGYIK